jgi:hypothetical protein
MSKTALTLVIRINLAHRSTSNANLQGTIEMSYIASTVPTDAWMVSSAREAVELVDFKVCPLRLLYPAAQVASH